MKLLRNLFLFVFISYVACQERCSSEKSSYGTCTGSDECSRLLHLAAFIKIGELHANVGNCGFDGQGDQRVCCPVNYEGKCTGSPDNIDGTCQPLTACPEVERLYKQLPINRFRELYGGCSDSSDGNSRWCCPDPIEKCDIWNYGGCQRLHDCAALKPVAESLTETRMIELYGGGCTTEKIGDTKICCPLLDTTISTTLHPLFHYTTASTDSSLLPSEIPPSRVIAELGSIIPVEDFMTWDDAQKNCKSLGGRLVEGIRREHIYLLNQPYIDIRLNVAYVGMKNSKWVHSGAPVDDNIWNSHLPNGTRVTGEVCGRLVLHGELASTPGYVYNYDCSSGRPSMCQVLR